MAALDEGTFSEICLIGVTPAGKTEIQFASKVEEFTPTEGDKDVAYTALTNGGRVMKKTPQGDYEITMKLYEVDVNTGTSLLQHYYGYDNGTNPISAATNTRTRNRFRVAFLWSDDPSTTLTAGGATASGYAARRMVFTEARMTSYKQSWEDKTLVQNVTFKGPAFTTTGTGTITHQSTTAAAAVGLSALSSYV